MCINIFNPEPTYHHTSIRTTRTGTDAQKWRSHGGLAAGKGSGENGGEGTANKKQKW